MMTSMNIAEFPMLLAAGALDFDITIVFQFVIFILAIALLHNILIKPYLQTREARDEGTEGSREEADEMQQLAVQRRAEYEDQLSEVRRDAMDNFLPIRFRLKTAQKYSNLRPSKSTGAHLS